MGLLGLRIKMGRKKKKKVKEKSVFTEEELEEIKKEIEEHREFLEAVGNLKIKFCFKSFHAHQASTCHQFCFLFLFL